MADLAGHKEALLAELYTKRSGLQKDLSEIDQTIAGIVKFTSPTPTAIDSSTPQRECVPTGPFTGLIQAPPAFATMSVRWAILQLLDRTLSERPLFNTLTTSDITKILLSNGKTSEATRFENNVSATLSNMKSPREEVHLVEGRWKITSKGQSAIQHIRYKNRSMIWNLPINWSCLDSFESDALGSGA